MPTHLPFNELLACPRCDRTPLAAADGAHQCAGCKTTYPAVGGIPWLFAEPDATLGEWRNRLHFELRRLAHAAERLESALGAKTPLPQTTQRLEAQLAATRAHRDRLQQLLQPLDLQPMQASYESHLALRTRLPRDQGLSTYYANVHRDWDWGADENEASLDEVRQALAADKAAEGIGDTLVLGAGACRLAYDVHRHLGAQRTVALDFNPLLLLIARDVMRGETLELHEFPIAPKSLADVAPLRTLRAPEPAGDNFFLVSGDVLRAPFRPGAFDTVITPWLVDIVSEELREFAARINRLLRPGGRWVNFGSLAFEHPEPSLCYSREEALAIVAETGFGHPAVRETTIPYMCSPASRHGRRETVLTFAAAKESEAEPPPRHKALPDWLVTGKEAVPLTPSFRTQALTTRIYGHIMSLIDGRRSIDDMATLLEKQQLMTREEAVPAIRNFLTRMYDDSRQKPEF